ncbi:hypothetical protein [Actinoalloteichus sp. GBA129-24]|uniref:hypothetical protein n=1 Tax=Actinoalloteichus sp. GBA129-24 TaxID=1612551 RepID=UPI000950574E|nr:hypothetical protein [Actinoalloteichus sp. GBA129-24]APU20642.1 ATP-grasp domain [Actinoalloteichus sp. GBA129-24]
MRIAVIGEFRADRVVDAITRSGHHDLVLLGPTDVADYVGRRARHRHLAASAEPEDLLAVWTEEDVELVIPSLYPVDQEQLLPSLAAAADAWRGPGRHAVVHSTRFADLVTDKAMFHRVALAAGWPVPEAVICDRVEELESAVRRIGGLPVMVKEARSLPRAGRWHVDTEQRLTTLPLTAFPVVVQRVCRGEEFGLELLSGANVTDCWPIASFGPLDQRCIPGHRARLAPIALPPAVITELAGFIRGMTDQFDVCGPWQIDFAVCDGRLQVLEVNGRLSGMADLSAATTGLDPYDAFVDACLGQPRVVPPARRLALELPIRLDAQLPGLPWGVRMRRQFPLPTNRSLPVDFQRLLVTADDPVLLAKWLRDFPPDALLTGSPGQLAATALEMSPLLTSAGWPRGCPPV